VFEAEHQRQYSRDLLFSTVVELMTLVSLRLRPSLHAAARQKGDLPVSSNSHFDFRRLAWALVSPSRSDEVCVCLIRHHGGIGGGLAKASVSSRSSHDGKIR
jgi:hypothetical protein